jgi:hypothetical protein
MDSVTVTLEQPAHIYRLPSGQVVPSVTQILAPLVDLAGIPRDVLAAKADLGRRVHTACHYLSEDDLDPWSIEGDVRPYLDGFVRFLSETGAKIIANERIVYNAMHGYAGQLDLVAIVFGRTTLIDLKTSIVTPLAAGSQTAAYQRALGDPQVTHRAALRLRPDGTYRFDTLNDPNDWSVFVACLTLHRYMEQHRG